MDWTFNRIALGFGKMRITAELAAREVPQWALMTADRLRRGASPRRVTVGVLAGLFIITPVVLFIVEHERHKAQRAKYRGLAMRSAAETTFLETSVRELLAEQNRLSQMLLDTGHTMRSGDQVVVKVMATGYSSTVMETDDTPFITAANTPTREGILALSRYLFREYTPGAPFSFGARVRIPGVGEFIVEDSMNERWSNRVDVWFPSRVEALRFGVREAYLTTTVEDGEHPRVDELSEDELEPTPAGL